MRGNRATDLRAVALGNDRLSDLGRRAGAAGKVRNLLSTDVASRPSFAAIAKALRTSARTLRRRLQMQNTSFRQLSDELRTVVALRYLRGTEMTNDDIAFALGFSDAANFRHAFRRWTGGAPNDYRTPAVWSLRTDFSTPLAPTRWPGRVKAAAHQGL